MELDDLKNLLKDQSALAPSDPPASPAALQQLLKSNPQSPINKMVRNLWLELYITIGFLVPFSFVVYSIPIWSIRVYFAVLLGLCWVLILPLFLFARKISKLSSTALPVKKNLETIYALMKLYVKRYMQFVMGLLPIFFALAFSLGFKEGQSGKHIPAFDKLLTPFTSLWQIVTVTVLYIVFVAMGTYYFTKWYLKKLYGQYLEHLAAMMAELEE